MPPASADDADAAAADDAGDAGVVVAAATVAATAATTATNNDLLVTFSAAPPRWFVYIAESERPHSPHMPQPQPQPQPQPAHDRAAAAAATRCCACPNAAACAASASSPAAQTCDCYAEAKRGLDAIRRHGPDAVVLLVECGECRGCALPSTATTTATAARRCRAACRPTQGGVAFRVDVRDTRTPKGRGVFAAEDIPAGAFVMEYAGETLTPEEARARLEAYDAARRRGGGGTAGAVEEEEEEPGAGSTGHALLSVRILRAPPPTTRRGREDAPGERAAGPPPPAPCLLRVDVDATVRSNAARFVNHRCSGANLGAVVVMPRGSVMAASAGARGAPLLRVALFASRAIPAGEELTFSYAAAAAAAAAATTAAELEQHQSATRCCCGADGCTGWLPGEGG